MKHEPSGLKPIPRIGTPVGSVPCLVIAVLLFLSVSGPLHAETPSSGKAPEDESGGGAPAALSFRLTLGTHLRSIGFYPRTGVRTDLNGPLLSGVGAVFRFGAELWETHPGIPGPGIEVLVQAGFLLELGGTVPGGNSAVLLRSPSFSELSAGKGRYSLFLSLLSYLSTDGTSQLNYFISGSRRGARSLLTLSVENNLPAPGELVHAFTVNWVDEFRTAAVSLRLLTFGTRDTVGGEIGLLLWTGTRGLVENQVWGDPYDLSGRLGAEYSHGILYGAFILNRVKFSLGLDSEQIRDFFQNTLHRLINEGAVPMLDRDPRLFFQVTLGETELHY